LLHTGETELQTDRAARRPRSRAAAGRQAFADLNLAVEPLPAGRLADGDRLQRRATPVSPDRGHRDAVASAISSLTVRPQRRPWHAPMPQRVKGLAWLGPGRPSATGLVRRVFYRRFETRRQVAGHVGLSPSPCNRGTAIREQGHRD
jgi:hypothetical protein